MMQIMSIKMKNRNFIFHNLLMNFLSWLSDKQSIYFDQSLLTMMSKLVQQLKRKIVQELKDRSINIIYISTTKIIIDSKKKTIQPTIDYFEYFTSVFSSIELLKDVDLNSVPKYWRFLMYQSPQKHIGLEHNETNFEIVWKEIDLLPAAMKETLQIQLINFMINMLNTYQRIVDKASEEHGEM